MKIEELINKYVNGNHHERKLGRYWSSEIYSMDKGYLTPANFFKEKNIDDYGSRRVLAGLGYEMLLNDILQKGNVKYEYNPKKEMKINDEITLVVKPDFLFDEFLWELKTPNKPIDKIPDKWKYQLECESQAFDRKAILVVASFPFTLKFYPFTSSKRRWEHIKEIIINFHNKLKQLQK